MRCNPMKKGQAEMGWGLWHSYTVPGGDGGYGGNGGKGSSSSVASTKSQSVR